MTSTADQFSGTPATATRPAVGVDTRAMTRAMRRTAQPTQISKVPYLPGLDGIRALAVVAVMIYHANHDWLAGGFIGVEVFFVISGYLITLLIIAEDEKTGGLDLRQFWIRRARRLLPALFLLLVGVATYTAIWERDFVGQLRGDVIAGLTYITNWYQIWTAKGYTASNDFAPLRHLWSLAVEEQFYVIWPLVMVLLLRLGRRRLPNISRWLILGAIAITAVTAIFATTGEPATCAVDPNQFWELGGRCINKNDTLYLSTITRAGGLMLGGAMAMLWRPFALQRGGARRLGLVSDAAGGIGLVVMGVLAWFLYYDETGASPWLFRGGLLAVGLASVGVIMGVTHPNAVLGKLLGNPVLLWVGTRSYGLYLFHWPIYQAIRYWGDDLGNDPLTWQQFAAAMIITVVVTEASYRIVETPIRKKQVRSIWESLQRRRDPTMRRIVAVGGAATVAVSVFAGVALATAPLKGNPLEESLREAEENSSGSDILSGDTVSTAATVASTTAASAPAESLPPATIVDETLPGEGPSSSVAAPVDPTVAPTAAVVPPSGPASTDGPTTTVDPATAPIAYLAVGDSVMVGAKPLLEEMGITVSAEESRQFRSIVDQIGMFAAAGRLNNTVVIALGTNGPIGSESLTKVMDSLRNTPRVFVLTVWVDKPWEAENNQKILALPATYPNVTIIDWRALAQACPGDCFYNDDGHHLKPDGQRFYADQLKAFLGI